MTEPAKGIAVASTAEEVYVQVVGRGTFQNSQPLHRYAQEMIDRGHHHFILDLRACTNMDSTFLGVLAGMGLRLRNGGTGPAGEIRIVNAGQRSVELLQILGLDRLFAILPLDAAAAPVSAPAGPLHRLPDSDVETDHPVLNKRDTTDLLLAAHTNLVRVDQRNEARFGSVTRSLRDSLNRQPGSDRQPDERQPPRH
ncbi:STAS domain-containing protein [bacterium]|nr:STAS domain-containing protein [bacterium]